MMQKLKKWLRRLNEPAFDELPKASGGSAGSALVESKVVPPNPPPRQQSLQQLPRDTQQGQARADGEAQQLEAAVVAPPPAAQPLPGHDRRSTSRSDSIPEVGAVCISRPFTRSAFFALQPYTLVSASGVRIPSHSQGTSHAPPLVT